MIGSAIKQAIDELGQAFNEFKQTNDERLVTLEKKIQDPLGEDKLARLNDVLDKTSDRIQKLSVMSQRPAFGNHQNHDEHKHAFLNYLCKGQETELRGFETKRLGIEPRDGGFLLPDAMVAAVYTALKDLSPMRDLASVVQTSQHKYELIVEDVKSQAIWGEQLQPDQRNTGTETSKIRKISYPIFTLLESPRISSSLLEDASFNIEQWLVELIGTHMARAENFAFINGDGAKEPSGLLNIGLNAQAEDGQSLHVIKTGVDGGFAENDPEKKLVDLVYSLKPEYLRGSSWMMSRSALAEIRKMKTNNGHYIWQPTFSADMAGAMLLGYPVVVCDDLPAVAKGKTAILFGNFKEGYLIVDRLGMTVLRDPYSAKPDIDLLVRRRVGGGWKNPRAIKGLQFSV